MIYNWFVSFWLGHLMYKYSILLMALLFMQQAIAEKPVFAQAQSSDSIGIDQLLETPAQSKESLAAAMEKLAVKGTGKRTKLKGLTAIELELSNASDKALLIDGTEALLVTGSTKRKCASLRDIEIRIPAEDNTRHKYIKDLTDSVASFGSIGSIPAVHDQIINGKPVPQRYGLDQARRDKEVSRLEKRVLLPGEQATGFIYFAGKFPESGASIELNVQDANNEKDTTPLAVKL